MLLVFPANGFASPRPGGPPASRLRPSMRWILAGIAVIVAAIAAAGVTAVTGNRALDRDIAAFQRVPVPGAGDVRLAAGDYTIYVEYGGLAALGAPEPVRARIGDPDGRDVPTRTYESGVSYRLDGGEGSAEYTFRADRDGRYHLVAEGGPGLTLAVGPGVGSSVVATVLIPLGIAAGGGVFGLAVVLFGALRTGPRRA